MKPKILSMPFSATGSATNGVKFILFKGLLKIELVCANINSQNRSVFTIFFINVQQEKPLEPA